MTDGSLSVWDNLYTCKQCIGRVFRADAVDPAEADWCSAYMQTIPKPSLRSAVCPCLCTRSISSQQSWQCNALPVVQVNAVAYDNPIPGFGTNNVTNLRLFESQPVNEFNLDFFNEGNFDEVSVHKRWPQSFTSTTLKLLSTMILLHASRPLEDVGVRCGCPAESQNQRKQS